MSEHRSTEDYPASVATTWRISVDRLCQEEPRAIDLLNLCAFLSPEPIPRNLLADHHEALPPTLGKAVSNPLRLNRLIGGLRRYTLVEVTGETLRFHRFVQAATREHLTAAERRRWVNAAVELMRAGFPFARDDPATWQRSGALLAHALAAAGHAEQIVKDLEGTRWLLNETARYLKTRAEFEQAKVGHARALGLAEAFLGPEDPEIATYVNNLGDVLLELGDLPGAKAAFERALKIQEAGFGPDHPNVAIPVNNLGGVLKGLGDLTGAKAAFERALKIDEASFGPHHSNVATGVNNLGLVLQDMGDLAGAKTAFQRALEIDETVFGPDHPNVARDVNNLGGVLKALGELAQARAAYERALEIDEASFGPDHPEVAIDAKNLGEVLEDLGDLAVAKATYERALSILERSLGPDHPNTRKVRGNLDALTRG